MLRELKKIGCAIALLLLGACASTFQVTADTPALDGGAQWVLLPMINVTDTPQAGLAAEDLLEHALRQRGIVNLKHYPSTLTRDSLFEPTERKVQEEAQRWAREQNGRYAITGSVQEWHYKVGVDGEPAVGLTLRVIELGSGRVLWSASGADSGWSRSALTAIADTLVANMTAALPLIEPRASQPGA